MADTVRKTLNLADYGLPEPLIFDVPKYAQGDDGKEYDDSYFPRNEREKKVYMQYLLDGASNQLDVDYGEMPPKLIDYMAQFNPPDAILNARKLQKAGELAEQRRIDPIGFDAAVGVYKGGKQEYRFNDSMGTLLPGFDPYTLGDFANDMGKTARKLMPEDPRQLTRISAIIGADTYLMSKMMEAKRLKMKQPGKLRFMPKFYNWLAEFGEGKFGTAKQMAVAGSSAGPVSYAADSAYSLLNKLYAYTQGQDSASISEMQRGALRDAELEMMIGMGAAGLGPIASGVKKYAINYPLGFRSNISVEAVEKAARQNIPLSKVAASEADWVKAYSKIIGVFPAVGGPLRQSQAEARVAINQRIQDIMSTLSPGMTTLRGMQWAGKEAFDAFSKNVSKFRATNAIMYNSFFNQASKIDEAFIPTTTLKKWTNSFAKSIDGGDIRLSASAPDGQWINTTSQLFNMLKVGDPTAGMKLLTALGSLPEHITLKQFRQLQAQLNGAIRGFGGRGDGAMSQVGIDPQGTLAYMKDNLEHGLNDYKSWKKLTGPNEIIAQSSIKALRDANEFYMNNIEMFGFNAGQRGIGKASQQVNRNIFAPGAPFKPGSLMPDQIFNRVMTEATAMSPMAIKEIQEQLGKKNFANLASTYLNKIIGQNTEIIETPFKRNKSSARMGVQGEIPGGGTTQVSGSGGQIHDSEFVPVFNVDNLRKQLGMIPIEQGSKIQDRTSREAVIAMFDAMGQNGQKAYKDLEETLDIASLVNSFDISDVSDFVKRRGVLGGVKSIANAFVIGGVVTSPLATAGLVLFSNRFSKFLGNPTQLSKIKTVMGEGTEKALQRANLINTIRATESYYTILDNDGAITEMPDVSISQGGVDRPMLQRQPGQSSMNNDLRTVNYFNNLIKKANAGELGGGLEALSDIELLDYVILGTNGSPNMGQASMSRPKYDRQGDILAYETVDQQAPDRVLLEGAIMENGMVDSTPASIYGFKEENQEAINEMINQSVQAPRSNPFLVNAQEVLQTEGGPAGRDFSMERESVNVSDRSNLNPDQQAALIRGDTDAAILAGRN